MRKKWLIAGLVFVLLGAIMILLFEYSTVEVEASYTDVEDSWEISYNYKEGENMSLSIWPHADWSISSGFEEGYELPPNSGNFYDHVKVLTANITDENGNFTILKIFFVVTNPEGGAQYVRIFPDYFEVNNSHGSLIIAKDYPKTGEIGPINIIHIGKVSESGNYTVSCTLDPATVMDKYINGSLWIHPASPPERLRIYRLTNNVVSPYRNTILLYGGITLIVSGTTLIFIGTKKVKKKHYSRTSHIATDKTIKINWSPKLFSSLQLIYWWRVTSPCT